MAGDQVTLLRRIATSPWAIVALLVAGVAYLLLALRSARRMVASAERSRRLETARADENARIAERERQDRAEVDRARRESDATLEGELAAVDDERAADAGAAKAARDRLAEVRAWSVSEVARWWAGRER